jgi:hypothetical protein
MTIQQTISKNGLAQISVENLRSQIRGRFILPEDELYNEGRKVYNGMIDKRPALIARCTSVADIMEQVSDPVMMD